MQQLTAIRLTYVCLSEQALVSRETSPLGSAVLSVTRLAAGEGSFNVVPDKAVFGATLRSLSNDHLMHLKRRVEKVGRLRSYGRLLRACTTLMAVWLTGFSGCRCCMRKQTPSAAQQSWTGWRSSSRIIQRL
jgi:hypothetical protein